MAFNNLGLQEPSTVTARVATVTIQRGSTLEHQEILVLGDATSSNAVAQVTNAAPSTSAYGLAVRQVDAVQSAQNGAWTVRANLSSTGTDNPVTAAQSGNWTVRANLSSTSADNPVTASQAGTWNIGTVTAVSSLAGIVAVRPSDTNWASSAGFHFNSSGELLTIAAAAAASTTVNVSSLAGNVRVVNSSAADLLVSAVQSGAWTVRANLSSTSADNPVNAAQVGAWTVRANLSSTSADNPVTATLNLGGLQSSAVAGSNSSALLVRVVSHGSSAVDFPVRAVLSSTSADNPVTATLNLGGLQSSAVANSNSSALLVRVVAHGSSAADFPVKAFLSSTSADNPVNASQVGTWNIGTVTTVSSLAGIVAQRPSDTNWASSAGFHFDSSGALQISGTINASASTVTTVSAFYDSSNVAVQPGDATNKAIRVNVVAGTIVGGSGGTAQADQSAFTTNSGSITPIGGYFSTTASAVPEAKVGVLRMSSVRALWTLPVDSTGGDMTDTTNRALRMNVVAGGSTTVNVSSVGGVVTIAPVAGSTWTVHIGAEHQSTAVQPSNSSAINVRVVGGVSSAVDFQVDARVSDNLGNDIESSTNAVGTNSTRRGLAVRSMLPLSTYASGQAASSGDVTVFTSVDGQSIYVYGVCLHWGGVMTTNTNQLVKIQDGNGTGTNYMQWRFQVSAIGATTQPLQAFVAPPAYLFRTAAATNLRINAASSGLNYSLYAWYE